MDTKFINNEIVIESNFGNCWSIKDAKEDTLIWIHNENDSNYGSFGLSNIPFIIETLTKIQNYYNNIPKKNDSVRFISGRMNGLTGIIKDIDNYDDKKPLVITIDDNEEMNNCTYFCDYDEIEVIK